MKKIIIIFLLLVSMHSLIWAEVDKKLVQVENLANSSKKFQPYCWYNREDIDGCFIMSSIILIGYNENKKLLAFITRVEGQKEDSETFYQVNVQNLSTNEVIFESKIKGSTVLNKFSDINLFYSYYKKQIMKTIVKYGISESLEIKYLPYKSDTNMLFVGFSETMKYAQFGYELPIKVPSIKNLIVKKNDKLIFRKNYSNSDYCKECTYPFFLLEPLTIIELQPNGQKILVVGLLSYSFHSPKTVFFQLIGI